MVAALPPGPRGPGAWQGRRLARDPLGFADECRERFGEIFTLSLGALGPTVMVCEPELVGDLLAADGAELPAGRAAAALEPLVGRSVLLLDDAAHERRRRLLAPPMHGDAVRHHRAAVAEIAAAELATWTPGDVVTVRDRMRRITLEVLLRAVLGLRDERRRADFRAALGGLGEAVSAGAVWAPGRGGRAELVRARQALDALLLGEIAARRRGEARAAEGGDVLSHLVEARTADDVPLTDRELRDELLGLLAAGWEPTATALAWSVDLLLRRPAAAERIPEDGWLEAVRREVLRLRPPVLAALRVARAPFELGPFRLPRGTGVGLFALGLHRRADLFPEPHAFRPERWGRDEPPASWLAFGGGTRRCLGEALAAATSDVVVREVFRRVRVEPVHADPEPVRLRAGALVPGRGVPVRVLPT